MQLRDGEVVGVINPHNLFATYLGTPRRERAEYIRHCVRMAMTRHKKLPEDFESASPDLRPRIWARATLEQERLRGLRMGRHGGLASLPGQAIGEHLQCLLAYDWPESVQTVSADDLAGWGVTVFEAMEAARRNLDELTTRYARLGLNLYTFAAGDSYDASRLSLIDRIEAMEIEGQPVAMAPSREHLFITGSDDEVGLSMMVDLAARFADAPYPLSSIPLILSNGEWTDWRLPEGHPMHDRFMNLAIRWLGPLYAEQKELLEALHKERGIDVFVASFSVLQRGDGVLVSYCVWGEGCESLLPETRKVVLMKDGHEGPVALGTWARVMQAAGMLLEPTDDYPRRYRTRGFPDDETIRAIGLAEM